MAAPTMILIVFLIAISTVYCVSADLIKGCGGFVEASSSLVRSREGADGKLDYSHITVELQTVDGLVKDSAQCAPHGYYFIPVYDKGSFILKINGPEGWSWNPDKVPVLVDDSSCNNNEDINFRFTGFTLSGKVLGAVGGESCVTKNGGPASVTVELLSSDGDPIASVLTSSGGSYLFKNIIPGKYNIRASHPELQVEVRGSTKVELGFANGMVDDIFFVRGYDLKGSVVAQMAWLVVALTLIIIWVASLCKIFLGATPNSKAAILDDGKSSQKKNVLFVIAHPDDESMFFSPTINYLTSNAFNLHMLCLSTGNMPYLFWLVISFWILEMNLLVIGNADGKGSIRKNELHQACAVLKVPLQQIKILDHPNFQDGFGKVWSHDLLTEIIEEEVSKHDIQTIITFDNYGVSGHCNHRDVHHGVLKFLQTDSGKFIKAWELVSLNIFRKYCGPVDIWLSILSAKKHQSTVIIINEKPRRSVEAMAQHLSQWVWFRKLFVSFSSYTYTNTLHRINP